MTNWAEEKEWSDKYLREIRMVLGLVLFREPPIEQDMTQNTDLRLLAADDVRIACRIRRHQYIGFKDDFTIRARSKYGAITEIDKMLDGWGDYIFYGFAPENENDKWLECFTIGDLNVFRREYHNLPTRKMIPNGDGTMFYAYSWKELPDDFIIARKHSGNNLKIYN